MADPTPKRKHLPIVGSPQATTGAESPRAPAAPEAPKRRLPLLQGHRDGEEEADGEEQDRPPWHWSGIGAVAIFIVWLPLAALLNTPVARALRSATEDGEIAGAPLRMQILMVGLNVLGFLTAAFAGGYLVGRFGGRAGQREAMVSGVAAGVIAWVIGTRQAQMAEALVWGLLLVVIAAIGGGGAYLGGKLGLARRGPTPK